MFKRSFSCTASKIWNDLPQETRRVPSLNAFTCLLRQQFTKVLQSVLCWWCSLYMFVNVNNSSVCCFVYLHVFVLKYVICIISSSDTYLFVESVALLCFLYKCLCFCSYVRNSALSSFYRSYYETYLLLQTSS